MALQRLVPIAAAATVAGILGVGGASLAMAQEDGSTTTEPSTESDSPVDEGTTDDGTRERPDGRSEGRPSGENCPKDGESPDSSTEGSSDTTTGS